MLSKEMLSQLGSTIAGLMFVWAMFKQYVPYGVREHLEKYTHKLVSFVYPFIEITFHEYTNNGFERSKAFTAIERYLGTNSSTRAKRLKADMVKDSQSLVLSMDDHEEITDEFEGIKIWWASRKRSTKATTFSFYGTDDEKRSYKLTFHRSHRDLITKSYLNHVLEEGKAIQIRTRQRKLYTNNRDQQYSYGRKTMWSQVVFEHPANFNTLGMDPKKKEDIINDLITFSKAKDYYQKIGKAWKRGYLLHGPPGTGKSTMIAAMANLLEYDVYDLELTAVKDNTELRRLLIDTSSKAIIVIEDIDCSLDLTGQRKETGKDEKDETDPTKKMVKKEVDGHSKVTLSGLLNFIDGLWSSCGGERLIVFTTNYLEKLDPALIRRGRMDKHIELSYCCFESFKVLAGNYLDVKSHELFETIRVMLEETKMTPADVAENLMPKSADHDVETSLRCLIKALETAKEEAKMKAEQEEKEKAEKEAKEKEEKEKAEKESKEKEEKEKEEKKKEKEEKPGEEVKEEKATVEGVKENGVSK